MSQPEDQIQTAATYDVPMRHEEPVPEEPAQLGPIQRLFGVTFSPGETFKDINRKPTLLAPFLTAVVTTLAASIFFEWRVKPDWDKFFQNMAEKRLKKPLKELPPDQQKQVQDSLNLQKKLATTDLNSPLSIGIAVGRTVLFYVFAFIIPAGIFALGLMLMQAKATFKKILSVVAWSWCGTGLVYTIVTIASLLTRDSESLKDINLADPASIVPTNLGVILPSGTSPALSSIAASFDVFTIWYLILLAIGFAAIAGTRKIKSSKAAALVFGVWGIWVLIKAGIGALGFGPR
jgi:Yip1 domain